MRLDAQRYRRRDERRTGAAARPRNARGAVRDKRCMRRLAWTALLAALIALTIAAPAIARPTDGAAHAAKRGVTITTRSIAGFGTVLVDGRGLPLYIFTADRGKSSRCYGACARAWQVTYAGGRPRAAGSARQGLLGTTRRADGRRQVTYRGRPLYYYVGDRPGVALCHDVREFGGLWLLIRASGRRV
jgi:predicted lipoprotein with Yx(FWY)xxD motif